MMLRLMPWDSGPVLERRKDVTLKVPLFVLGAPNVPGCEVKLEIYSSRTDIREWKVAFGQGRSLKTSRRSTFEAGAGEIKRIFVPVPAIAIRRYVLLEENSSINIEPLKGKAFQTVEPIGRTPAGWRSSRDSNEPAPGAVTLISPESDIGVRVRKIKIMRSSRRSRQPGLDFPLGPVQKDFYLKGDSERRRSTYEESVEGTRHFKLTAGATIFGTTVNTDAFVQLVRGISLKCTLAGGHDYHLHEMKKEPGIGWTLD
jgi:hypothetical protein